MPGTTDETSTEQPTTEQPETPAEETPAEAPQEPSEDEGGKDDELPEWARKKLTKANSEAAKYRTDLRDMQKRFEGAKTAEEFEAAVTEIRARNAELEKAALRDKVARKFKLPDDLAERLRGDTMEDLEKDAKSLQKYAVEDEPEPGNLSGGLDPSDDEGAFDPVKAARAARAQRW